MRIGRTGSRRRGLSDNETYESTDDLINEAVLLLADRHQKLADLRAKIEVGTAQIRNGQVTDGELAFQQLEAKYPNWASLEQFLLSPRGYGVRTSR
jgi:antitoxin ParD1/3/4